VRERHEGASALLASVKDEAAPFGRGRKREDRVQPDPVEDAAVHDLAVHEREGEGNGGADLQHAGLAAEVHQFEHPDQGEVGQFTLHRHLASRHVV